MCQCDGAPTIFPAMELGSPVTTILSSRDFWTVKTAIAVHFAAAVYGVATSAEALLGSQLCRCDKHLVNSFCPVISQPTCTGFTLSEPSTTLLGNYLVHDSSEDLAAASPWLPNLAEDCTEH